jgi:hypothetical protein
MLFISIFATSPLLAGQRHAATLLLAKHFITAMLKNCYKISPYLSQGTTPEHLAYTSMGIILFLSPTLSMKHIFYTHGLHILADAGLHPSTLYLVIDVAFSPNIKELPFMCDQVAL